MALQIEFINSADKYQLAIIESQYTTGDLIKKAELMRLTIQSVSGMKIKKLFFVRGSFSNHLAVATVFLCGITHLDLDKGIDHMYTALEDYIKETKEYPYSRNISRNIDKFIMTKFEGKINKECTNKLEKVITFLTKNNITYFYNKFPIAVINQTMYLPFDLLVLEKQPLYILHNALFSTLKIEKHYAYYWIIDSKEEMKEQVVYNKNDSFGIPKHNGFYSSLLGVSKALFNPYPNQKEDDPNDIGDCVIRSLCKICDMEWQYTFSRLSNVAINSKLMMSDPKVLIYFIENMMSVTVNNRDIQEYETVGEFMYKHKTGIYYISTPTHAIAYIDGVWYDNMIHLSLENHDLFDDIEFVLEVKGKGELQ